MTSTSEILAKIQIAPAQSKEAEECLSKFASLSEEEKKSARPSTIEKIFPLAFGDIAAIETSETFEKLKRKPW